ncbi:MAG TPA: hypothetical protein VNQ73_06400 [Ilumatobacter sp.]|nr:hypothetical protein [Ilumatobacter sp.]
MSKLRPVHVALAAVSAALATTLFSIVPAVRAANSDPASFVPIVPCRLADTRPAPANVGTRATPLGENEVVAFTVRGTNGQCTIPATASAIVSNVTAVNPTAASFVTLFPADAATRPTASNLNLLAGGPPTPNQVTVGLSDNGVVNAYNRFGTTDLIIDIVGYFQKAGLPGTVQGGTTLTGTVQTNSYAAAAPVKLSSVAPVALTVADFGFAPGFTGAPVNPGCTGTLAAPTAPAGKVCIYMNPTSAPLPYQAAPAADAPTETFVVIWPPHQPPQPAQPVTFAWAYTAP